MTDARGQRGGLSLPRSIRGRLLLVLLVTLLPVLVLQGWISYDRYRVLRTQELQTDLEVARAVASAFETFVHDVRRTELALGEAITLMRPFSRTDANTLLATSAASYPAVTSLNWLSPEGVILASSRPSAIGTSLGDRDYILAIRQGRSWSISHLLPVGRITGQVSFAIATGIRGPDGRLRGIVMAGLDPTRLGEVTLTLRRIRGGSYTIFDHRGVLVYRNPEVPLTWRERVRWGEMDPLLKQAMRGHEATGVIASGTARERRFAARVPMREVEWVAGAGRAVPEALAPVLQGVLRDALLLVLVDVLALLVALGIARTIASPLRHLEADARHFSANLSYQVREDGPNEVRQLAATLNRMAETLLHRTEEVESQRRLLDTLVTTMPTGVVFVNAEGHVELANPMAQELLRGDILGLAFGRPGPYTLHHLDGTPFSPEELPLACALRYGKPCEDIDILVRFADGEERIILTSSTPIFVEGKTLAGAVEVLQEITGAVAVIQDITERRQFELAMQESEERFRSLFEQSRAVMLLIDAESGAIVDANLAAAEYYGYSRAQLREQKIWDINLLPPEEVHARMDQAQHEGHPAFFFQHRLASGEVREVEVYSGPVPLRGRPLLYSIIIDITERQQAEAERERLLAELNATLSAVADGLIIYTPEGQMLRTNPAADRMFNLTQEVPSATHAARWVTVHTRLPDGTPLPPDQVPTVRALRGEPVHGVILVLPRLGQPDLWLSVSAGVIRTPDGRVLGAVATYTDITDLHDLQKQQEIYTHTISHDLRAPLTVIKGHADLLLAYLAETRQDGLLQSGVSAIQRASERMNVMIQDLVDAARLEGGQLALACRPVALADYLEELLRRHATALEVARVYREVPAALPPVLADPNRLERILVNLLSNALKYSAPGTPVRLTARARAGMVEVAVTDQGQGIAPGDLPHLFERFYRATGERKTEGIGLGLYITRMLVEAHGGQVWVESTPGVGSTFTFTLPVAPARAPGSAGE